MKGILFTLALAISSMLLAQEDVLIRANQLFQAGKYSESFEFYQEAGDIYQTANDYTNYVTCNLQMAQCHLQLGSLEQCDQHCQSTLEYLNEVLPDNNALQVNTLLIQAQALLKMGRNDQALEVLQKAEQNLPNTTDLLAAQCFNDLGVIYWNTANTETARSYYERSLNIRKTLLPENDKLLADSYLNLGTIDIENDFLKATINLDKAQKIYHSVYGSNHPQVALCYSNLAFANSFQKNYPEALRYLDMTMEIWNNNYTGDHPNKAFTLSNKGRVYRSQGFYDKALFLQQDALQQYLRLYGSKHPEVANTHYLIGQIHLDRESYKDAVRSFQKAIYTNLYDQEPQDLYSLPELNNYFSADILLYSLQYKAQALDQLHFNQSLNPKDIKASLDTYIKCDDMIRIIRQRRLGEADKIKIGSIASSVYENGIRISLYLSDRTLKKQTYLEKALTFCERSKSAVLQDAIAETKAKSFAGIPDELIHMEDSLKESISWLERQLAQSPAEPKLTTLKNELFEKKQAYHTFIASLENDYPEYFNLKYQQKDIALKDIQQVLDSKTAILNYFIGENNIYILQISAKGLEAFTMPKVDNFIGLTKGLRNSIKYRVAAALTKSASELYTQLIPKIPGGINHLIIIPDGILGTIPFESLIKMDKDSKTYFLEDYSISYENAASLLISGSDNNSTDAKGILLAAPVTFDKNEITMSNLPGTEHEVREIKYLFLSSDNPPQVLLNADASEQNMKSDNLEKFKYIHFATHGVVNEGKPELSRIFLKPGNDQDGSLYSGEIYGLKLKADLVTLSACETGLGKVEKGEGIIGLSRSLKYAGAQNLIVSLWQVSDASTADLMIDFYTQHLHHTGNTDYSSALRSAKLHLLKSENYKDPYFWAPFILIGN